MDRQQIRELLGAILEKETGQSVTALPDETPIVEQFGLDSVDLVSLMMQIEGQFRIRMARDELAAVASVGSLLDVMEEKLSLPVPARG